MDTILFHNSSIDTETCLKTEYSSPTKYTTTLQILHVDTVLLLELTEYIARLTEN